MKYVFSIICHLLITYYFVQFGIVTYVTQFYFSDILKSCRIIHNVNFPDENEFISFFRFFSLSHSEGKEKLSWRETINKNIIRIQFSYIITAREENGIDLYFSKNIS